MTQSLPYLVVLEVGLLLSPQTPAAVVIVTNILASNNTQLIRTLATSWCM